VDTSQEEALQTREKIAVQPVTEQVAPRSLLAKDSPPAATPAEVYVLLENDDDSSAESFVRDIAGIKETIHGIRMLIAALLLLGSVLATVLVCVAYHELPRQQQRRARELAMLASIPIVALLFTWFHIWLAIQMMFRPVEFVGLWQHAGTGTGLGWQGVVPRKAHKMAKTAYSCARPYLEGPSDWLRRVDSSELVAKVRPHLAQVIEGALAHVGSKHFKRTEWLLPAHVRRLITDKAIDKIQETSPDLWMQITGLLLDKTCGIDNDGMIVKVFTENKELLNRFFLSLGESEFRFIERCGAAMGFVCGLVQLVAFNHLGPVGRAVFLPGTGFLLGIVTNWLAIMMVFKPCFPVPVVVCGCHICDVQGLFLKRQQDVAVLYSKMLCDHFLSFNKVVDYLQTLPELWEQLKEAYVAHNTRVLRHTMGFAANWLAPMALGKQQYDSLEEDLKVALVHGLKEAAAIHKIAERYIGKITDIERKNCAALQKMPPNEFENLLHPVFQEDEWILILLGGILGAIVGIAQVHFLSK